MVVGDDEIEVTLDRETAAYVHRRIAEAGGTSVRIVATSMGDDETTLRVAFTGRGPTQLAATFMLVAHLHDADDLEHRMETIDFACEDMDLDRQRRRFIAAQRSGLATPIFGGRNTIRHLRVDRDVAAMIAARTGLGAVLRELTDALHGGEADPERRDRWNGEGGSIVGTLLLPLHRISERATFDGRTLVVHDALLPHAARIAAPGRRLGDIVDAPAAIADRLVMAATRIDDGEAFLVRPRPARIDELLGIETRP